MAVKKIGFYGGSFNPIHNGHLNIAKAALDQFGLDEIWFVVTGVSPHKNTGLNVNRFARYEMTELAISGHTGFVTKDIELFDTKKSFSVNTLKDLKAGHPDWEFFFIMGEDSIDSFSSWYRPADISALSTILVAPRADDSKDGDLRGLERLEDSLAAIRDDYTGDFYAIKAKNVPISSSALRESITSGQMDLAIKYLPGEVLEYIKVHRIFGNVPDYNYERIRKGIEATLKPERYNHSLRVANTAAALANVYNYPQDIAYTAGLLHDCGKYLNDQESLDYCSKNNIPVTDIEAFAPYLLHGKIGAHMAAEEYGIDDPEMTHAISIHTTGRPDMGLLDKIIYVADYIEPERYRSKELNTIRAMAYRDLDTAIVLILKETLEFLEETGKPIDKATTDTLEFYERKMLNGDN